MGQYYYLEGADPIGPFSLQDVYTLIDREVVGTATMICREGGTGWEPLPAIHELTGKTAATIAARSAFSPPSKSGSESKRSKRVGNNTTAIVIAVLFSIVAIYVTYAITHQSQDTIQEMDHLPGQ